MSAEDFPAAQVADWISTGGQAASVPSAPIADPAKAEWFVAYTNPRREADVVRTCRRRRVQAYMPAMTVTRRRADVQVPLFPRYVFVGLEGSLYALRETPGLEGVVRMGFDPVRLSADSVAALKVQEHEGVFDFSARRLAQVEAARVEAAQAAKVRRLQPGMPLRIVEGPWRSFSGIAEELLPPDRISVFIKLFGRSWALPMRLADVEPA